jgi:hypothetical protein
MLFGDDQAQARFQAAVVGSRDPLLLRLAARDRRCALEAELDTVDELLNRATGTRLPSRYSCQTLSKSAPEIYQSSTWNNLFGTTLGPF